MATTEINLTIKIDGLDGLQKLIDSVGQLNKKPIEIKINTGLPNGNLKP